MKVNKAAVVGAGNMGAGIAQKMATEGVSVLLLDTSVALAKRGHERIGAMLEEGVVKALFARQRASDILARVEISDDISRAREADVVIEAVFEDLLVKRDLFNRLGQVCGLETILATNTSSFLVRDLAQVTAHPERVLGLHYFYHPAKNRLVEVVPHDSTGGMGGTHPQHVRRAWLFQEALGKTPIASRDAPGFVVNRFFVPWLNEAVRLYDEGYDMATIEAAAQEAFGVGMGPFELMNVTGVPIALHAATSLGRALGPFYAPSARLQEQVDAAEPWSLPSEEPTRERLAAVAERLWQVVHFVALELVSEGVSTPEDVDIGARVGLRWPVGPFEHIGSIGWSAAAASARAVCARYDRSAPRLLAQGAAKQPFVLRKVKLERDGAVATITINRPDQLNALDPDIVAQLEERFAEAEEDPATAAIVLAGAGKAFVAGADIKFFVNSIRAQRMGAIAAFAQAGQRLLRRLEQSPKRVVCRLDGMALGGGAELALACHGVVATPHATMAFPESGIGIYPGLGGTQRLTRRIGLGLARYYLYSGGVLGAADLHALGLAWRVVPLHEIHGALDEAIAAPSVQSTVDTSALGHHLAPLAEVLASAPLWEVLQGSVRAPAGHEEAWGKLVRTLARKAPLALAAIERLTAVATERDLDEGLAAEGDELVPIFASPDALEGLSAVLERRRPSFSQGLSAGISNV